MEEEWVWMHLHKHGSAQVAASMGTNRKLEPIICCAPKYACFLG